MKVNEFTEKVRTKFPHMAHLDDSDIMFSVAQKKPELLKRVDKDDLALSMKESRTKQISKERRKQFGALSGYSRFASGTGQGMMDVYQGIKQMFGGDTEAYKEDKAAYMDASKGDKTAAAGEIFGAIASTAPIPGMTGAKLASKAASPLLKTAIKAGTALGTGAAFGATEHVDEDETRLKNTAYGALFGAGGAGAGALTKKIGSKAFNALKGKMKNAKYQELLELEKKHDLNLSLGDVTQNPNLLKAEVLAENIPLTGTSRLRETGGKKAKLSATDYVEKAKKEMLETGETFVDSKGKVIEDVGNIIQESGRKHIKKTTADSKKLYQDVSDLAGDDVAVATKTLKKANDIIAKEEGAIAKDTKLIKQLTGIKKQIEGGSFDADTGVRDLKPYSYDRLQELKVHLGGLASDLEGKNTKAFSAILSLKDELVKDIDTFAMSNPKIKPAWLKANKHYAEKVVPLDETVWKNALKSTKPDKIFDSFMKKGQKDMARNFYSALEEKGQAAVRYNMVQNALDVATKKRGIFSPADFTNELEKLSKPSEIFFKGAKNKELGGIKKVMSHNERVGQYMENPPTGNRISQMGGVAGSVLGFPEIQLATGAVRLLSSKKGKKFILAANDLEPGSIPMQKLISKIIKQLPKISAVSGKELTEDK